MSYRGKVTVDIDGYVANFELLAIRSYYNLQDQCADVDVHISSGGEGIHLIGWFERRLTVPERLEIRRNLRDDGRRIQFDLDRFLNDVYCGVLWSGKHRDQGDETATERGHKDRSFSDIHDALDHMTQTNSNPHDQMQRLAEHGHKAAPELARRMDPAEVQQ